MSEVLKTLKNAQNGLIEMMKISNIMSLKHHNVFMLFSDIEINLNKVQQALTPLTAKDIIKEYKSLKGYEDKRVEYLNGNFVYYPMDKGIMKNTYITIAGSDRNGYRIQGPITKEFMHKITTFFMNGSDENGKE